MGFIRLVASAFACGLLAAAIVPAMAAEQFPFDQDLVLDAAPMRPGKRMPMLTVAATGDATIGLWCKTVSAHVEFTDAAVKIEPGPLPEALPEMMGNGQCTPQRVEADEALLAKLAQVTAWRVQGGAIVLEGSATLKFRAASN